MLYFNHKKCTRYFKSFILNLFEIEILNDESLYEMYRVFSCLFVLADLTPIRQGMILYCPCGHLKPVPISRKQQETVPFTKNHTASFFFLLTACHFSDPARRHRSGRTLSHMIRLFFFPLHVSDILKNIAEIKCSKVILRSLCTADHLDTAVFLEKKLRAL